MKKVNFLPEDYLDRKAQQRTNWVCLFLFVVVIGAVAGGFVVTERRQTAMDNRVRAVNLEMRQASESLKQLELLESKRQEMMCKASVSASLMEPVPRSLILATITNSLPAAVSLEQIDLVSKKVQPPKALTDHKKKRNKRKIRTSKKEETTKKKSIEPQKWNTQFKVSGVAQTDLQVAQLIAQLNKSPLFKEVNLLYSEEYEKEHQMLRTFALQIVLGPNARASETDVEMARQQQVRGM